MRRYRQSAARLTPPRKDSNGCSGFRLANALAQAACERPWAANDQHNRGRFRHALRPRRGIGRRKDETPGHESGEIACGRPQVVSTDHPRLAHPHSWPSDTTMVAGTGLPADGERRIRAGLANSGPGPESSDQARTPHRCRQGGGRSTSGSVRSAGRQLQPPSTIGCPTRADRSVPLPNGGGAWIWP